MSSSQFALTLAKIRDAAEIARLSRTLIEQDLAWSWKPQRVAASIRSPGANVVVARADHGVAGFGIMRYGDDEAHLDLLAVAPSFRGAGLGRRLLEWLERPALLGGIGAVILEVRERNRDARAFYERLGYRMLGRLDGYYQGRESAIRMKRELGVASRPSVLRPPTAAD